MLREVNCVNHPLVVFVATPRKATCHVTAHTLLGRHSVWTYVLIEKKSLVRIGLLPVFLVYLYYFEIDYHKLCAECRVAAGKCLLDTLLFMRGLAS